MTLRHCLKSIVMSTIVFKLIAKILGYSNQVFNYMFCQSMLETANFSSEIFRKNNNCFGMKKPKLRPNLVIGENLGHAVYSSKLDSWIDLFIRHNYFGISMAAKRDVNKYAQFLIISNYAEDSDYVDKINTLYKNYG